MFTFGLFCMGACYLASDDVWICLCLWFVVGLLGNLLCLLFIAVGT